MSNWQQTIIWATDGVDYWYIHAALGPSELNYTEKHKIVHIVSELSYDWLSNDTKPQMIVFMFIFSRLPPPMLLSCKVNNGFKKTLSQIVDKRR